MHYANPLRTVREINTTIMIFNSWFSTMSPHLLFMNDEADSRLTIHTTMLSYKCDLIYESATNLTSFTNQTLDYTRL